MRRYLLGLFLLSTGSTFCQNYDSLKLELSKIYESDQHYRIIIDSLVRKANLDWNHPEIQKLIPAAAKQDSINLTKVVSILNQYGWVGQDRVGVDANQALFVVIQHADSSTMMRYFPLLVKSYEMGETPGKYFALMLDRLLVEQGKKQLYGTQIQMEKQNGSYSPFPIEQEATIDIRRKKVGLPPLHEYLKEINK